MCELRSKCRPGWTAPKTGVVLPTSFPEIYRQLGGHDIEIPYAKPNVHIEELPDASAAG